MADIINFWGGGGWLVLWILPVLKTRAQYNSNNHLTGASVRPRPVGECLPGAHPVTTGHTHLAAGPLLGTWTYLEQKQGRK